MALSFRQLLLLAILSLCLSGCASISKGIAESIFEREDNKKDTRACDVNGPAFRGLESFMKNQGELISPADRAKDRPTTKILMIHGIGHHLPGYSTRFSTNLTRRLKLNVTAEIVKEIDLTDPAFGNEPLGHLAVHRFFNKTEPGNCFSMSSPGQKSASLKNVKLNTTVQRNTATRERTSTKS